MRIPGDSVPHSSLGRLLAVVRLGPGDRSRRLPLRACFVELRAERILYALVHEKDLSNRSLRRRMGSLEDPPSGLEVAGQTAYPLLVRHLRRDLLCLEEWLPLADVARRLSALVYRLLSLPKVLYERALASDLPGPPRGREGEGQQGARLLHSRHGLSERKTIEEGAESNGYDAYKNVKGRKRHLLVDTLGLPLSVHVTPASVQDRVGARLLLVGLKPLMPRLRKIWADGAYGGEKLAKWCEQQGGWELEVVERDREVEGFRVLAKRWIVERTFGWLRRDRRLARDYERKVQTSETLIEVAMIRLILKHLARAA